MDPKISDPMYKRRHDRRYWVTLPATMQIPLMEGGSAYLRVKATVENLSLMGIGIQIEALNEAHRPILERVGHRCSLTLEIPDIGKAVYLSCRIAWIDIRSDHPRPEVFLGLNLIDTELKGHLLLSRYLSRVRAGKRTEPPPDSGGDSTIRPQ